MEEEKKAPHVSYEAQKRYQDKAMKRYNLMFHRVNDSDVIECLDKAGNKTDFIRTLIRKELGEKKDEIKE